jgi:hypothetical protein
MQIDIEYRKLKDLLADLVQNGCTGIKLSTEDGGMSLEFINHVNNRIINGAVALHMKVGGPDAQNDIRKGLELGATGLIGPMVESPFGVVKFVKAVRTVVGEEELKQVFLSINLESLCAYEKIDEILATKEFGAISEIVIGTNDLALSVSKPVSDPLVLDMVEQMSIKIHKTGKIVRVGGLISTFVSKPDVRERILGSGVVDEINTTAVAFGLKKIKDLKASYLKAINFEYRLIEFWSLLCGKRLEPFQRKAAALKKTLDATG